MTSMQKDPMKDLGRPEKEAGSSEAILRQTRLRSYRGNEKYVFLSYAHKDIEMAMEIIAILISNGVRVWFDEGIDPGTEWGKNIAEHVQNSSVFFALISKNYLASDNCLDELAFARDNKINSLLIYLENIKLPIELELRHGRTQNISWYSYDRNVFTQLLFRTAGLSACTDRQLPQSSENVTEKPNQKNTELSLWMKQQFPDIREYREYFRIPIATLLASPEPLPTEELERLLGMYESDVLDLRRRLKIFLKEGTDDFKKPAIAFKDQYDIDWLCSEEAGIFRVSQKDAIKALAKGCWTKLQESPEDLSGYEALWIYELLENAEMKEALKAALMSKVLYDQQIEWGDWCDHWGKYNTAERLYHNSEKNAQNRVDNQQTAEARNDLARSYRRLGDVLTNKGDLLEAYSMYQTALIINDSLAKEQGTSESRRQLAISHTDFADNLKTLDLLDWALEQYQKALEIRESLEKELGTPESRRDLSVSYINIADVNKAEKKWDDALALYQKALDIRESLEKELGTPGTRRDLSISYSRVAGIYEAQGKLNEALALYQKGLAISESLAEELGTPDSRRDLSISYEKVAGIYEAQRKLNEALELYQKSLAISESLAEELGTPDSRRDLSISYNNVAGIYEAQGKLDEALELYQKGLAIRESLAEELETPMAYADLCRSYIKISNILEKQSNFEIAFKHMTTAKEISEKKGLKEMFHYLCEDIDFNFNFIKQECEEGKRIILDFSHIWEP